MSLFFSAFPPVRIKIALTCAVLFLSFPVYADPGPESPFREWSGYWTGSGIITMTNGATERIRCRATNAVNGGGSAVEQVLRCASDTYQLDISSNVISRGGRLSGSWSEATRGVSGSVSGRASSTMIAAYVAGPGFVARLDVRTHGNRQSVSIRPQSGTDIAAVSVALHKV